MYNGSKLSPSTMKTTTHNTKLHTLGNQANSSNTKNKNLIPPLKSDTKRYKMIPFTPDSNHYNLTSKHQLCITNNILYASADIHQGAEVVRRRTSNPTGRISIFHFSIFTFEFKFLTLTFAQNFGNTLF